MMPGTLLQVALFALFIAPGIMYASVRVAVVGHRAADLGAASRLLEALFVGIIFDALYALLFFPFVSGLASSPTMALAQVQWWQALVAVLLLLVLPGAVAVVVSGRLRRSEPDPATVKGEAFFRRKAERASKRSERSRKRHWYLANGYRSTPLAWDFKALNMRKGQFVRVRTSSGLYYAGWYGERSFMSTYPRTRDIFIEHQWHVDTKGDIGKPIENAGGIWLAITDECVVEWISQAESSSERKSA